MSKVILTVGIPASGKSTWAKANAESLDAIIICRDDIRIMQGLKFGDDENAITEVANALLDGAIRADRNVIIADTNISKVFRNRLIKFCHQRGADVEIKTFPISLDEAIRRDSLREATVGADVIRKMHDHLAGQQVVDEELPYQRFEPYSHFIPAPYAESRPGVVVVDVDGTIAKNVSRSPYDYSKVSEDEPIQNVIDAVESLAYEYKVIFVSGRDASCRDATLEWLNRFVSLQDFTLFTRKDGDKRPDWIIKNEIYDRDIIPNYNIVAVLDDRRRVVTHLRKRGITVFQVAAGNF